MAGSFKVSFLILLLICSSLAFAEDITITTYYPSPYGSYSSLQADKLGVGDLDGGGLTSSDVPTTSGDVWIKGNVAIGKTSPTFPLDITGTTTQGFRYLKTGAKDARLQVGDPTKTWSMAVGWGVAGDLTFIEEGVAGDRFVVRQGGNVGVGTTNPGAKMEVIGTVRATAFSATTAGAGAYMYNTSSNMAVPDYVFEKDYQLMALPELKKFVLEKKHLPGLVSAKELKDGGSASLVEQNFKNLEKIEELVLYILQLKSENEALEARVKKLEAKAK